MIVSVVNEYHWHFKIIDEMYIDCQDHAGLEYWYNEIVEMSKKLNKK